MDFDALREAQSGLGTAAVIVMDKVKYKSFIHLVIVIC